MTPQERAHLKITIQKALQEVREEIARLEEKTAPVSPDKSLGRLTRLEAIGEKSINESILREATRRLKRLEFAAQKVEREDFGLCRICEEPIPLARLKLLPESTICVSCANDA